MGINFKNLIKIKMGHLIIKKKKLHQKSKALTNSFFKTLLNLY